MASWRLRPARSGGTLGAALLVVLVSGCATAPGGGAPQRLEGQGGQQQAFVAPLAPPAPNGSWTPNDVVLGFLAASANFELDPSAAQQYLAPGVPLPWDNVPGQPPVVTVVTVQGSTTVGQRLTGGPPTEKVTVTGERLASLSSQGDYLYEPGTVNYTFLLGNHDGKWLIQQLPSLTGQNLLLLSETAFEEVFQPRNLYFFGQSVPSVNYLVPDPVFVPLEVAGATDATSVATELVQGLLEVSGNQPTTTWLSSATDTAFPEGTELAPHGVTISNLTARVSLEVPGASSATDLPQMYAQLYETLTSSAYSPAIVQHVQLVVNGKVEHVGMGTAFVPAVGSAQDSLYYATTPGVVSEWNSAGTPPKVMTPDVLSSNPAITAVAVSPGPNPQVAVAVPYRRGCEVFVGGTGQANQFKPWPVASTGGACTSLSWDNGSNLWIVAGSGIWVLEHKPVSLMQVDPPPSTPGQVVALRIAPDGVRAAFLVHTTGGNEMLLAAVTYGTGTVTFESWRPVGPNVPNPTAISWYKTDDLIALGGGDLWEVPLTGGVSQSLTNVPTGTVAISAAGSNALAVRTRTGELYTSATPGSGWGTPIEVGVEAGPDYPG